MFQEYLRRIGLLLGGLLVSSIGITLMLQANIGLEPWSVLQQGMSKTFGITYGTAASIVGAAVIAIAYFCGESFGLGTLANIFVCPIFIDILLYLNWVPLFERFSTGLAALLIRMELLALGTWMYMKSTLGSGPRDALMVVLTRKTHRTVGLCRGDAGSVEKAARSAVFFHYTTGKRVHTRPAFGTPYKIFQYFLAKRNTALHCPDLDSWNAVF